MATLGRRVSPDTTLLRPILATGRVIYPLVGLVVSMVSMYIYTFYLQIEGGHGSVTGQATPVGAVWGLYVASIIFFIGVSHVGIGVSAATRLLELDYLKPYARIAELLTMFCLPAAVLIITLDIGRPERFIFNVIKYVRVQAPFVWSATVISAYLSGSLVYLYLSMRRDFAICADLVPKWRRFYKLLAL